MGQGTKEMLLFPIDVRCYVSLSLVSMFIACAMFLNLHLKIQNVANVHDVADVKFFSETDYISALCILAKTR